MKEFSFDEDDYEEFALIIEEDEDEEDEDDPFVEQVTMGRRSGHSGVGSSLTFIITHPALQYDTPRDPVYWEF